MRKKALLTIAFLVAATLGVVGMSAFEAHVINVTAEIENALSVSTDNIPFGTVFPQEHLESPLLIAMSSSFFDETRVDDINYVIKQKPKPKPTDNNGGNDGNGHNPNETIEVPADPTIGKIIKTVPVPDPVPTADSFFDVFTEIDTMEESGEDPFIGPAWEFCETHVPAKLDSSNPDALIPDFANLDSLYYDYCYPWLCPYISKEKDPTDDDSNDTEVTTFHNPFLEIATGHLSKIEKDTEDKWIIDLDVPCFDGMCAQDWTHIGWELQPELEHQMFGCDLWIEVVGISLPGEQPECGNGVVEPGEQCDDGRHCEDGTSCTEDSECVGIGDEVCVLRDGDGCDANCESEGLGCSEKADVMQVLDRSGSIGTAMATLKTAAKAFVVALNPTADGVHMGQTSFADNGSLDQHLTDNTTLLNAAIDALVSDGFTNLYEGISLAQDELDDPTYDRTDGESPDFMVIITDGQPNRPMGTPEQDATDAATAAKNAGTVIYVVGVGDQVDATYLANNIATDSDHYFDAANFGDLEAILEGLAECNGD